MDREIAKELLLQGKLLKYHVWCYGKSFVSCGDGCCDSSESSVEDVLDSLEFHCDNWDDVKIID